jgi:hypothetical protein
MNITSQDILEFISISLSESTRQWIPGKENDAAAIKNTFTEFQSSRIHPELGIIDVEPHIAEVLHIKPGEYRVWFITSPTTQRVFFDEKKNAFGVAWGPNNVTGKYIDLGIRTNDAIDAFLT